MRSTATAILCAAMTTAAFGAEKPIHLKQALGLDKVEANCTACHSLDYVQMNSNFLNASGWNAEVAKMINAFGAPISPADAKIIAEYLTANYGVKEKASGHPPREAASPGHSNQASTASGWGSYGRYTRSLVPVRVRT